ncbi:hypothetical protein TBLA_0D05280 [Henningerozyma blattae CBS 6284]|uniref:Uncharacterized protein n=1 Tax=Henningerozyma blattae (strain ATCC 34711 / CBS 6284 / DSM 70876 / NBRC 10599 / NRRL Y-10934 / UCD 77-7) TaxID=1071380 RepID=I2H3S0_HENB6|nr:hypothetical protein TBLA_0D05280 [Tetrapisispora blattae CBS 6284]CCH61022.1 hypothetical protein TBLA_0D05280 [Tetrapisispora blattae CBS 6284]
MATDSITNNEPIPPPDNEEIELAKLVFGDTSDFQNILNNFDLDMLDNENQGDEEWNSEDENEQANINDDQLFFVDDGMENDEATIKSTEDDEAMDIDSEEDDEADDDVAWVDSDDERLNVPLTSSNKTKKLRTSYTRTIVSGTTYINRLREQFERIYPRPDWANDDDKSSGDEVENAQDHDDVIDGDTAALSKILQLSYNYKDVSASKLLKSKILNIVRLKDANISHASRSGIQSLSFHPTKPILLTGGYDKTLRLYHIDGKSNNLVTSVHLKGTPIQTCTFYVSLSSANSEQKILTGGRKPFMHSWDLSASLPGNNSHNNSVVKIEKFSRLYGHEQTQKSFEKFKVAHFYNFQINQAHGIILLQGNTGWVNILHLTTGVWLMGCKIEGTIADFCVDYRPLSKNKFKTILISTNTYGEIWEFDLSSNGKVLKRWKDQGGVGITTIQVGGGTNSNNLFPVTSGKIKPNRWLALGSESGYVTIYDRNATKDSENPTPAATLGQITRPISHLVFSPDGQLLCMASKSARDILRLVHLPSCTVYSNWPTSGTPLGKVTSVAFSPRGEMIAVGNEQAKVRLWRLNDYN